MPSPDPNQTFVMDLAALLKAFREVRDGAAQVVEQLTARLEACRDLDTKAATALTQVCFVRKVCRACHKGLPQIR